MAYTILRHTSPEMMQTINGRVVVLDYYVPFVHLEKTAEIMLHILACCAIYSPLPAPPLARF